MNWWLFGLLLVVAYQALQNWTTVYRFKQVLKGLSGFNDLLAEASDLPKDKADELRKTWEDVRIAGETRFAVGTVFLLIILVFLVVLAIHGSLAA